MGFWAVNFWAVGFWADNFWVGLNQSGGTGSGSMTDKVLLKYQRRRD